MNTLEKRNKETVTEEQIRRAAIRAGYHSEDLKKECAEVCNKAEEENKEYISLSEEEKQKLKEAKDRLVGSDFDIDNDPVNNPSHYQSMSSDANIDCITAMRAAFGDYEVSIWCKLNAFKYNWRCDDKGGNQDVEKAIWNLNKFLELGGCDQ
jgi:hypothetical protein